MTGQSGEPKVRATPDYMNADWSLHLWSVMQMTEEQLAELPSQLVVKALDDAKDCLATSVDWDWSTTDWWLAVVSFLEAEYGEQDVEWQWTVSTLAARLRELEGEGWGDRPVFLYNKTNVPVPHLEQISTHHNTRVGHIVLSAEAQYEL